MALDRGTLARIDRRVFSELNHSVGMQVVKVPVSDAVWSIWRRYCDALDVTMGQAVAGLISHELESSVAARAGDEGVFEAQRARVLRELEVPPAGARRPRTSVVEVGGASPRLGAEAQGDGSAADWTGPS